MRDAREAIAIAEGAVSGRLLVSVEGVEPPESNAFGERVIVERALSVSFIAALPTDEQARAADEIRALIAATPSLAGRATVAFPYVTHAYACRRRD